MREIAKFFIIAMIGLVSLRPENGVSAPVDARSVLSRGAGADMQNGPLQKIMDDYCQPGTGNANSLSCEEVKTRGWAVGLHCKIKVEVASNTPKSLEAEKRIKEYCKTLVSSADSIPSTVAKEKECKDRGYAMVLNGLCSCGNKHKYENGKCVEITSSQSELSKNEASIAYSEEPVRAEIASVMVAPTESALRDKYCVVGDTTKINCGALSKSWVDAFGCNMKIGINKRIAEEDIRNYCENLGPESDVVPGSEEDFRRSKCEESKGYSRYMSGGTCECKTGSVKFFTIQNNNNNIYRDVQICDVCSDGMEPSESGNGCKYTETSEYKACIAEKPQGAYWGADQIDPTPHCICASASKKWDGTTCVTIEPEDSGDEEKKFLADFNDMTGSFLERARGLIDSMGKAKPSAK